MPKFLPIVRVPWNPRMSTRRLNELLATPNIHEDDEGAIMGELWLRDGHQVLCRELISLGIDTGFAVGGR
jgi:hypothetical protein